MGSIQYHPIMPRKIRLTTSRSVENIIGDGPNLEQPNLKNIFKKPWISNIRLIMRNNINISKTREAKALVRLALYIDLINWSRKEEYYKKLI